MCTVSSSAAMPVFAHCLSSHPLFGCLVLILCGPHPLSFSSSITIHAHSSLSLPLSQHLRHALCLAIHPYPPTHHTHMRTMTKRDRCRSKEPWFKLLCFVHQTRLGVWCASPLISLTHFLLLALPSFFFGRACCLVTMYK